MATMAATVDEDIASELTSVLAGAAGVPDPAAEQVAPAPPRKPEPDGQAEKPRPPRKPRPPKDDAPRTAEPEPPVPDAGKDDYTEGLMGLGGGVWLVASGLRGGKIPLVGIPVPDLRPYAWAFRQQLPALVKAANEGAKHNATVRKYVVKYAGDSSNAWMLGAGIAVMGLLGTCIEIGRMPADQRAQLAAANDKAMQAEIAEIAQAMGLAEAQEQEQAA